MGSTPVIVLDTHVWGWWLSVDTRIALKSVQLPGPLHTDPADRIIIATALVLGGTLITKDEKLLQYPHVKTFW